MWGTAIAQSTAIRLYSLIVAFETGFLIDANQIFCFHFMMCYNILYVFKSF